ncbi:MAG: hypothetical protein VX487_07020, partial [Actinomycetota bacterium]|nr:hypothetical protein [Actinomycetota bacterium]
LRSSRSVLLRLTLRLCRMKRIGLIDGGDESIIVGCAEIVLLLGRVDLTVPYFPTTWLHATVAVDGALASQS